jgi:hypothetical protein
VIWAKIGGILAAIAAVFLVGFHFGGMASKTTLALYQASEAENTAKAVLAERTSAQAQAAIDHTAETRHAKDLTDIAALAPISTPLLVYRTVAAPIGTVPGAQSKAGPVATHPAEGGGERVGRAVDIRDDVEALKKRLEVVMADYRELDAEWPR